jgi:hypothetical protein
MYAEARVARRGQGARLDPKGTMPDASRHPHALRLVPHRPERHKARQLHRQGLAGEGNTAELVDAKSVGLPIIDRMYKEHPVGEAPAGGIQTDLISGGYR